MEKDFKDFLDALKEKVPILDIVSKHTKLTRRGRDWFGRCPFHSEKTGSFKVDPERGFYHCFGCGAHGDIIKFVMEVEKLSFPEALQNLAGVCGMVVPERREVNVAENDTKSKMYEIMEIAKNFFAEQLRVGEGRSSGNGSGSSSSSIAIAREYLKNRNISAESIAKFQLGFASNEERLLSYLKRSGFSEELILKTGIFFKGRYDNNLIGKFSERIIFPIIDSRGRCVGFGGRIIGQNSNGDVENTPGKGSNVAKYLNSPESEIFIKNHQLYGYHIARRSRSADIVLVEGYMDVIAMHQAGFSSAVAPLGTTISETQINMCWKVCDNPIMCLDGDSAGIKASFRWLDRIMPLLIPGKSFRCARLPQDSDPDALILNDRSDIIASVLRNAQSLSDWMWDGAFLLYPSDTPEEKAAIVKMLREKVRAIKDGSIERLYAQYLKQKENDLYRYKWKPISVAKAGIGESVTPAVSVKEKIEKILIVTVINHPYIIDRVIEDFLKLEFSSSWGRKMKEEILHLYDQYYVTGEVENGAEAIAALRKKIANVEKEIEIHAKFVKSNNENNGKDVQEKVIEEIVNGWNSFFEKYLSDPAMQEDLQRASVSLQSSFSESDWQRLKALKNNMLFSKTK